MINFFSYNSVNNVDMDRFQEDRNFDNYRYQYVPQRFSDRSIDVIDYEDIKYTLGGLIQDERNAAIFYENMLDRCDNYYEGNLIRTVSQASRKNYKFLNSLYRRSTNRCFRVRNTDVIRDINFNDGVRMAILTENDMNRRAMYISDFITDIEVRRRFNRYLIRKGNQINFLNSVLY